MSKKSSRPDVCRCRGGGAWARRTVALIAAVACSIGLSDSSSSPPPPPPELTLCELLVVGAGISGTFTAARYRQFNPNARICIVEMAVNTGGRLQSLPLDGADYAAEFGGMRYFPHIHTMVPTLLQQLGLETTTVPYVNTQGIAYVRGDRIPITDLGKRLPDVYQLRKGESGVSPNDLYDKTIAKVLAQQNITFEEALTNDYLTSHTMFNVLIDAGLSTEAIASYTDTAGYEWVLGSNAAVVAQEDLAIEGWNLEQVFVRSGFQSVAQALDKLVGDDSNTVRLYTTEVTELTWDESSATATIRGVEPAPGGDPIPPRAAGAAGAAAQIKTDHVVITGNPLQLFSMASWPWDVKRLMFEVEQVETMKIFIRFSTEWWSNVVKGGGRSITTLPLRQVWVYAPNVLMVYADADNAKFWKPLLQPYYTEPTPAWKPAGSMPLLWTRLVAQLAEMFGVKPGVVEQAGTHISFAYWSRCTAFWVAGCNITANVAQAAQPIDDMPVHFASDIWSTQQGWVEGALLSSEAALAKLGVPSILDVPAPAAYA